MYNGSKIHKENLARARASLKGVTRDCRHCKTPINIAGLHNHQKNCYLNPLNIKECPNCSKPIKNFSKNLACSKRCSNLLWPRRLTTTYRGICFKFHKKACCVCDESRIVEVHHFDGNNKNNDPVNLVPLCPTHHKYWHSKYKHLILDKVLKENWSAILDLNQGSLPSKGSGDNQAPLMAD